MFCKRKIFLLSSLLKMIIESVGWWIGGLEVGGQLVGVRWVGGLEVGGQLVGVRWVGGRWI